MKITENTPTERKCYKCNEIKPLTTEYFYKEKGRQFGFAHRCKACDKAKGRNWHPNRVYTPEQIERRQIAKQKYAKTLRGKVITVLNSCRSYDQKKGFEFDLTFEFVEQIISKPCIYCGDTNEVIGCDRLDNSKGHIQSNVVPSCKTCNITRFDNFSFDEMLEIGKCVSKIKAERQLKNDYG